MERDGGLKVLGRVWVSGSKSGVWERRSRATRRGKRESMRKGRGFLMGTGSAEPV